MVDQIVDWCRRARECKSYACCFSGAKLFRRGAKHAPGHRSTSTIRENGSGAKCDARSYDTAEATKYPHFRPVAFEVAGPSDFFRLQGAVPKIEVLETATATPHLRTTIESQTRLTRQFG